MPEQASRSLCGPWPPTPGGGGVKHNYTPTWDIIPPGPAAPRGGIVGDQPGGLNLRKEPERMRIFVITYFVYGLIFIKHIKYIL